MGSNATVEPRDEYRSYELPGAARRLVEQVMLVKPGENVVISADTGSDMRVVQATAAAVYAAGAHPVVINYEMRPRSKMKPPAPVAGAVREADVWIEFAVSYVLYTEAYRRAVEAGCRYIPLEGMDVGMMLRTIGNIDIPTLLKLGDRLTAVFSNHDSFVMTSREGSNLTGSMKGRRVRHQGKRAENKGETVTLAGQVTFMPIEESLNGTVVLDGSVWPPEINVLSEPIRLTVERGVITGFEGGREARQMEEFLRSLGDPNMFCLAHFSLGMNPGVLAPTGRMVEDERLFGCVTVGIGAQGPNHGGRGIKAVGHADGTVTRPTFILDGQIVEDNGRYTDPESVDLCRTLGIPGY